MKTFGWQHICFILILLIAVPGLGPKETKAAESHIPDGITMQDEFKPGYAEPLGIFKKIIGRVVLIHAADTLGYWAQNDLPLYMKDMIVTPEEGLALLQFLDESTISVAADSELVINRFIFDPAKFDRSTFLSMGSGKSRFWVRKLQDYTRSEFKVKTKTMIAGVRGSDFVLVARPDFSEAFALENTVLEIASLAAPDKVVVLRSFEKIRVNLGQEASPIEKITPGEAARLRSELPMPFDRDVMDAAGIFATERTRDKDKADSDQQPTEGASRTEKSTTDRVAKEKIVPTEKGETVPGQVPVEESRLAEKPAPDAAVKEEIVQTEEGGAAHVYLVKGKTVASEDDTGDVISTVKDETALRQRPAEEIVKTEQAATGVAVKEEIVPTDEDGISSTFSVKDEIAAILDVRRETVILFPEENLAAPEPVVEESTSNTPLEIPWIDRVLVTDVGVDMAIQDEGILQQVIENTIIEDVILVDLPGLPGTP